VAKRYLIQVAGYNLGVILRTLFGIGKPRAMQGLSAALHLLLQALDWLTEALESGPHAGRCRTDAGDMIHVLSQPVARTATTLSAAA